MSGWTAEDDATLRRSLESANGQKLWPQVALAAFPDGQYSKRACMERWKILSKPKPLRGPWTKDEDAKLEGLVKNFGSEKWVVIATEMATRSGKQCRERWHNHLDPRSESFIHFSTPQKKNFLHSSSFFNPLELSCL